MHLIVGMGERGNIVADKLEKAGVEYRTWDIKDGPMLKSNAKYERVLFCLPEEYTAALPMIFDSYRKDYGAESAVDIRLKDGLIIGREIAPAEWGNQDG